MPPLDQLRGVLLIASATFPFAASDAAMKHLSQALAPSFIVAARYSLNLAVLLLVLMPRGTPVPPPTTRTGLVLVRALCLACISICVAIALSRMPIAETVAITFLAPVIVVLLARPLLGETMGSTGWIAAVIGFIGVLLIVRPGTGHDTIGIIFALLTACGSAAYQLLSRTLAPTGSTTALLLDAVCVGAIASGLTLPWTWPTDRPDTPGLALLLGIGLATLAGHFLFTSAYRHAPAAMLAPVTYIHLGWAVLFGWLFFGHVTDQITFAGRALVAAAGIGVALRPGRAGKSSPPLGPEG